MLCVSAYRQKTHPPKEILLSLASGGRLSSYSATYGIKVNFEGEGNGIKIPFDTARNNDFVNALGLSRMISLFAK